MIVVAIIGILSSLAVPSYQRYIRKANMVDVISVVRDMSKKSILFYSEHNRWPTNAEVAAGAVPEVREPTDYASDNITQAFLDNYGGRGRVIVDVTAKGFGKSGRIRYDMVMHDGGISATFCHDGAWTTDAYFRQYLPAECQN